MTDDSREVDRDVDPGVEPSEEELAALAALLSDRSTWAEPSAGVEDRLFDQITRELTAAAPVTPSSETTEATEATDFTDPQATVVPLDRPRPSRSSRSMRWRRAAVVLAAAALVGVGAVGAEEIRHRQLFPDQSVVLAGGDFAPGASAVARVDNRANGVRIVLKVSGLPPAPDGTFYAGWLVPADPKRRVPIGTFHMRDGEQGDIELWSGVPLKDYPTVSVTLQRVSDPSGPGTPVMRGRVGS